MKKYQIIYADPPWRYGGRSLDDKKREPLEKFYPTMKLQDIKKIRINEICDENCLLFLWIVSPNLKKCIELGEAWGFKYITIAFVWHKKRALLGNYTMPGCELCLLFRKGKIPLGKIKGKGNGVKQFYEEFSEKHSRKPNEIRNRIEKLFPISNRIELFAREKVEGWDCIGNGIDGKDIKQSLDDLCEN